MITPVDRLPRRQLERLQDDKLGRLGERLRGNDFFRDRVAAAGPRLDRTTIRDVEPVGKADLLDDQALLPPYGRRLGVPIEDVAMVHTTAGTSGRGQEIYGLNWHDVECAGYLSSFAFHWAGMRPGEAAAFHIGASNSSGGNAMLRGIQGVGQTPVLVAQLGFRERLELLRQQPITGMYASPSAINGLYRTAEADGLELRSVLPRLRWLLTSAEPFPLGWAVAMEEAYGARLFEDYGLTQSASSICASTCEEGAVVSGADGRPARGRMHFFEWSFLAEFLDHDTLEPAKPGEAAELVITALDKQASPLLRFKTNDRVEFLGWERCGCGRELSAITSGSITRFDDLLKIKGQNVWPRDMEAALFEMDQITEFAGEVRIGDKGRDELLLTVALRAGVDQSVLDDVRRTFKTRFNITPIVQCVQAESLPEWSTPEHKARRFKDLRMTGLAAGTGAAR